MLMTANADGEVALSNLNILTKFKGNPEYRLQNDKFVLIKKNSKGHKILDQMLRLCCYGHL